MPSTRALFLSHVAQTSDFPLALEILNAKGVYMYGRKGKKYIDLISGIGVSNVGHLHPRVVNAVKRQLRKYMHLMVYGEFVQTPQVQLAERLSGSLPEGLDCVYFVNSGSEAVEGALKLAKRYTARPKLVSCHNAYHGSSHGALSVSGSEYFKRKFRPLLPEVYHINFNQIEDLSHIDTDTAAVIVETVQGESGVRVPERAYMQALRQRCDQVGALLILDEIQAGFGRTGKFWAFEHFGIQPDILVCAKGMGGGMPIGAFISSSEIMDTLRREPILGHISTFGGHPVSCAASIATFDTIHKEKLMESVPKKALLFRELLQHPRILAFRGQGLMMAAEFESFELLKKIIDKAIEMGVLTDWFLFCDNSMRIAPPLIISEREIRKACKIIHKAIDAV
ncbi:MAG: aspartate aminotransferase family protein [Bernardetiaceae bacterium]|nr:aspartate aminotransferase family protein [Bernardetiaceae bacterium]